MKLWQEFWGKSHRIYVNERHREVHYRQVADDILSVLPDAEARVLDYGCGDALDAGRVAVHSGHLYLFDAAPELRRRLKTRLGGGSAITVLDEAEIATLPTESLDVVVVNSVVQYLDRAELAALLDTARRLLRNGGTSVLADIIPPNAGALADVTSLLRSAWRHGFLMAAVAGLAATFFSDYRRLRRSVGLATYAEDDMRRILVDAGFTVERRRANFGFNDRRMTFLARKSR